jgi:tRNA(Ile)-lysidine synthase
VSTQPEVAATELVATGLAAAVRADAATPQLLARCLFPPPGSPLVCAVSGGPDSSALLVLAVAAGCRAEAVHVDHGLRPGSAADAERVHALARRLGVASRSVRVTVEPGPDLEARARAARHAALPAVAAFGHTLDDQAETVLLNLLRGAGLEGMAGMRTGPRHPLLGLRRAETQALCTRFGIATVDDPTNVEPVHRRNRVRHEVMPLLCDVAARDVAPLLARTAAHARAAAEHLAAESTDVDPRDARALAAAPPEVARTALRTWLRSCSPERHPPDRATVDRVLAVARGQARSTEIGGGWRVDRHAMMLSLHPPSQGDPGPR